MATRRSSGFSSGVESLSGSVDTSPPVLSVPANLTVSATTATGANVTLNGASATDNIGTPTLTYSPTSGSLFPIGTTSVTVTAKDSMGNVSSGSFNVIVTEALAIVSQPIPLVISTGSPATFSVTATGPPPLSYQWRKAGVAIPGATASSYSLSSVQTSDAGAYSVLVTSAGGSLTSNTATLLVSSPVVITKQPASVSGVAGVAVTLSVNATGSGPLAYQWYRDGVSIPLATLSSYALGPLTSAKTGAYTVKVSNAVNAVTSSAAQVTLNGPPVIVTPPASATVSFGGAATLVASVQSGANFTYQWRRNGVPIGTAVARTGSTTAASVACSISSAKLADEGDYTVVVTNAQGSVESLPAKLQLDIAFVSAALTRSGRTYDLSQVLNNGSVDLLAAVPANDLLSVTVRAAGTIQYSWAWASLKGGGWQTIAGQTSSVLDFAAAGVPKTPGWFGLTVTVGKSIKLVKFLVKTFGPSLTLVPDLVITSQPSDLSVGLSGGTSQFSVVATGTAPVSYQWRKGGVVLKGRTAATLAFSPVSASDAGSYDVVLTNPNGSVVSRTATLTVLSAPVLTTQPVDVTTNRQGTASFSAVASGSGPLSYQWRRNGTPLANGIESVYSLLSVESGDAGLYDVVVSNAAGSVTSRAALLTVNLPVEFTQQPASVVLNPGGSAVFSVSTTGTLPMTYQWRRGGEPIPGATGTMLAINAVQVADEGLYDVVASNPAGSVASNVATLGVNRPVTILVQPAGVSVSLGGALALSVVAEGTAPLTYQWRKGGVPVAGATGAVWSVAAAQSADEGSYDVVVTNVVGSVLSSPANVQVNLPPTITSQPANVVVVSGGEASFSVQATGAVPMAFQWRKGGVPIPGAVASTFRLAAVQAADAGGYDVVVTNSAGSATSQVAALEVNVPPTITAQPVSVLVNAGSGAALSVSATGTAPMTYQWRKGGLLVAGATGSSLSFAAVQAADAGAYDVVVSNVAGGVTSESASVGVKVLPVITGEPEGVTVDVGSLVSLRVAATGTGVLGYQWRKAGVPIAGATAAEFRIELASLEDAGTYDVWVSGDAGGVGSRIVAVGINRPLAIFKQPVGGSVVEGGSWSLAVEAVGTGALSYQWSRDSAVLSGATGAVYMATSAGLYSVVVSDTRGSVTSAGASVQVTPSSVTPPPPTVVTPVVVASAQPKIAAHPVNVTVDLGRAASLQASVKCTGGFWSQWRKNGSWIGAPVSQTGQGENAVVVVHSVATCTSADEGLYSLVVAETQAGLTSSTEISRPGMIRLNLVFGDTRLVKSAVSYDLSKIPTFGGSVDLMSKGYNTSGASVALLGIPSDDVLQASIRTSGTVTYGWVYAQSSGAKLKYDLLDPDNGKSPLFKTATVKLAELWASAGGAVTLIPPGPGTYVLTVKRDGTPVALVNFVARKLLPAAVADQLSPVSLDVGLQSLLVPEGKAADFYVGVKGPVLRYTWYKAGMAVPVSGPSLLPYLILDPVGVGDAGDYRVEAVGPVNSVESGPVHLGVCPPGE